MSKLNKLKTIDLFAGIGGIRIAFEEAGFETIYSSDFDKYCSVTFNTNFETPKLDCKDIKQTTSQDLPDADLLLGGFPCQPFSIAGYRRGLKDSGRGDLFFDILRILSEKRPTAFLLENVKNLYSHDKGETYKLIKSELEKIGYKVKEKVLNTMEYGNLPQNRERIYIVGFLDENSFIKFNFPEPVELKVKIQDLLESNVAEKYYYNNKPLFDKLKNDVIDQNVVYQWRRKYVRANKKGVSPTLTANMGTGGHNVPIITDGKGIRKLTPRECARIQGFPDSYILPAQLPDSALYKQIGNSVSIPVVKRIALNIKNALIS